MFNFFSSLFHKQFNELNPFSEFNVYFISKLVFPLVIYCYLLLLFSNLGKLMEKLEGGAFCDGGEEGESRTRVENLVIMGMKLVGKKVEKVVEIMVIKVEGKERKGSLE